MKNVAVACRALGDPTRLRILRLLGRESLNATEITDIVGSSQSAVSRHLKTLREAGLVVERREGAWSFFAATPEGETPAAAFLAPLRQPLAELADDEGDADRLAQVLEARRQRSSLPLGSRGHRGLVPGRSWAAWARALLHLLPADLVVADIGCGDGGLTLELARRAERVLGVEPDDVARARAAEAVERAAASNVELLAGELEDIPLADGSVDLCLFSQVLHHTAEPATAVREAARILRPGGRLLVMDLEPHRQEWVREKLGDQRLGIACDELVGWFEDAGFTDIHHEALPRASRKERFQVNVTSGSRKQSRGKRKRRAR